MYDIYAADVLIVSDHFMVEFSLLLTVTLYMLLYYQKIKFSEN